MLIDQGKDGGFKTTRDTIGIKRDGSECVRVAVVTGVNGPIPPGYVGRQDPYVFRPCKGDTQTIGMM